MIQDRCTDGDDCFGVFIVRYHEVLIPQNYLDLIVGPVITCGSLSYGIITLP